GCPGGSARGPSQDPEEPCGNSKSAIRDAAFRASGPRRRHGGRRASAFGHRI
ncbi:MAG: hypothetical protein AVDCRST_MAG05-484, partial [uncultured Rubrobacteraceae bacterium]